MEAGGPAAPSPHWLIWDGDCGFCANAVAWLGERDQAHAFSAIPAQDCPSPPMTPALRRAATRAMIVVTNDGRHLVGGRAVLFALREVGWHPRVAALLSRRPAVWAVDAGYRVVASNRQIASRILFRNHGRGRCSIRPG